MKATIIKNQGRENFCFIPMFFDYITEFDTPVIHTVGVMVFFWTIVFEEEVK